MYNCCLNTFSLKKKKCQDMLAQQFCVFAFCTPILDDYPLWTNLLSLYFCFGAALASVPDASLQKGNLTPLFL